MLYTDLTSARGLLRFRARPSDCVRPLVFFGITDGTCWSSTSLAQAIRAPSLSLPLQMRHSIQQRRVSGIVLLQSTSTHASQISLVALPTRSSCS